MKYKATLNVKALRQTYTAEGNTVEEALTKLKPGNIAGMSLLTVNGKERVVAAPLVKRAYNTGGTSREVALKNLSTMFDGV